MNIAILLKILPSAFSYFLKLTKKNKIIFIFIAIIIVNIGSMHYVMQYKHSIQKNNKWAIKSFIKLREKIEFKSKMDSGLVGAFVLFNEVKSIKDPNFLHWQFQIVEAFQFNYSKNIVMSYIDNIAKSSLTLKENFNIFTDYFYINSILNHDKNLYCFSHRLTPLGQKIFIDINYGISCYNDGISILLLYSKKEEDIDLYKEVEYIKYILCVE